MKNLAVAFVLSMLAGSALAQAADPTVVNSTRSQLRALTYTQIFNPGLTLDASGTASAHAVAPVAGTVNKFSCAVQATSAGSSATISPSIGGVYMGIASTTIASSTAVGAVVSGTVTTSNTVAKGDSIRLQISSGLTGTGKLQCQFEISPTLNYSYAY